MRNISNFSGWLTLILSNGTPAICELYLSSIMHSFGGGVSGNSLLLGKAEVLKTSFSLLGEGLENLSLVISHRANLNVLLAVSEAGMGGTMVE